MITGYNYINGKQAKIADSQKMFIKINPCNGEAAAQYPQSTEAEVDICLRTATDAFKSWRALSRVQRAEYFWTLAKLMESRIKSIAGSISTETGKSLNESTAEVMEAIHMVQLCFGKGREPCGDIMSSEIPERDGYVFRKPKGVIAVITAFNFPFALPFWNIGPSLLEGNTVVFKPSELTPHVGVSISELMHEAGFPAGVFNLIHGDGEVGRMLIKDSRVNHISFTGSAETGRFVRISCTYNPGQSCNCETGSKSAVMVFDDGDLDIAVPAAINSAFKLSGQRCVSAGRILVQRGIFERFKDEFLKQVERVWVGNPFEYNGQPCSVTMGPIISGEQKNKIEEYNNIVRRDADASVLFDVAHTGKDGYWLNPFVYQVEWNHDKPYLTQEVFGPHVAIVPFDDLDDAVRIYNDTDFGLSLGVITNDYRKMREIRNTCDFGLIYFNLSCVGGESHFYFGGVKKSGIGGASAAGMFDNVVHKVSVTVNHAETLNFPQGLK